MSRRLHYLYPNEGKLIKAETLEDAIKQHPEVEQVVLFWSWESRYFTSDASVFEAYVVERNIDEEYSIFASRVEALSFAQAYDCWDGQPFVILNGDTLYGYNEEVDDQRSWNDGCDCCPGLTGGIDPHWIRAIVIHTDYETGDRWVIAPGSIEGVGE